MIGICTVLAVLFICFETHYFWRCLLLVSVCLIRRRFRHKKLLDDNIYYGLCTTTDLDFLGHMNNARYLRECDFGRFELWTENFVYDVCKRLGGSMTAAATTARYRKSLQLFDTYRIRSQVVCWDDKAFYVKQQFERRRDDFVCAVVYVKQAVINVTPAQVARELTGQDIPSPPVPPEVQKWIEFNEISSQNLRKTL